MVLQNVPWGNCLQHSSGGTFDGTVLDDILRWTMHSESIKGMGWAKLLKSGQILQMKIPPVHSSVLEGMAAEVVTHFRSMDEPSLCWQSAGLHSLWTG